MEIDVKKYEAQGFLVLKSPKFRDIRELVVQECKSAILSVLEDKNVFSSSDKDCNLSDLIKHILIKEKNNEISSKLYEIFPTLPYIYSLPGNLVIREILQKLNFSLPQVGAVPVLRLDRPQDAYRSTPIHQDYWYSMLSENSVVIWFSIENVSPDMGRLRVWPGSHKLGVLPFGESKTTQDYEAKSNKIMKEDFKEVNLETDEILVFSQLLLHQSGNNVSDKPRLSMQLRFNDLKRSRDIRSSFRTTYSAWVESEQQKYLISLA